MPLLGPDSSGLLDHIDDVFVDTIANQNNQQMPIVVGLGFTDMSAAAFVGAAVAILPADEFLGA
jgi:hypothetical protein